MAVKEAAPRYGPISRPSLGERLNQARMARDRTPSSSHPGWSAAADLADTPVAGLGVQLCGDAHLSNVGKAVRSGRLEAVEGV
jgi:Uncharacterized protein conserved in bacteria (DUF2252)